jgi:hypothetical protein
MRYVLTIGGRVGESFLLPPGTKIEPLMAALSGALPIRKLYAYKGRQPGDWRDYYTAGASVEFNISTVQDDQLVATEKLGDEEVVTGPMVITPDPYRRKRLKDAPKLLPYTVISNP